MPDLHAQTDKPLFISYSRANRAFAQDLRQKLADLGFKLWRDIEDMPIGEKWWPAIQEAIRACDTLVLCMSPESLASPNVADEWFYAREQGKRVMPVVAAADVDFAAVPRWMGARDWADFRPTAKDVDLVWARFIKQLNAPYEPRKVPFMVDALPPDFVERPAEFEPLVRALLAGNQNTVGISTTAALKGTGGYGKTTLARAICHDRRIRGAFDDGTLWVQLREKVTDDELKAILRDLIAKLTGQPATSTTFEALKDDWRQAVSDAYLLVVIDDVWDAGHLSRFLIPAKNAAFLVTTRNMGVLPGDVFKQHVDAMQPDEALALLRSGLPGGEEPALRALAKRLGEWPVLIKLANGALRKRIESGDTPARALDWVGKALTRKGFDALTNPDNPDERHRAASATLELSLELLDADQHRKYGRLAIFPEDVDIPLSVLEKLWGCDDFDVEDLCQRLADLSLLLSYDLGARAIRLHDVIRAYLRDRHKPDLPMWNDDYLAAYGLAEGASLPPDEPYLWRWIAYHLVESRREAALHQLLTDGRYLEGKTRRLGTAAVIADCAYLSEDAALRDLAGALELSAHVLDKKGGTAELMGQLTGRLDESITSAMHHLSDLPRPHLRLTSRSLTAPGGSLKRILTGHTSVVNGCAYSPDGCFLASASTDGTLRVWEVSSGQLIHTLEGHTEGVNGCAYSPDGHFLASAAGDRTLRVWDASSGQCIRTLQGHTGSVNGCAYNPDGHFLASAADDTTLRIWEVSSGQCLHTIEGHMGYVNGCAYSPDGRFLASASQDRTLRVWEASSGQLVRILSGNTDWVNGCAYSPDGRFLASASQDRTLRVWEASSGQLVRTLKGHTGPVTDCAYSPDGRFLASASQDRTLRVWEASSGQLVHTLKGHTGPMTDCAYSSDGRFLASASRDRTLRVWEASSGQSLQTLEGHTGRVTGCAYSPDGSFLASASQDRTLRVWEVSSGQSLQTLEGHTGRVTGCAYSPDWHFLASASRDHTLRVWTAGSSWSLQILEGHTGGVRGCAYSPDGRFLASASQDRTLRMWEVSSGQCIRTLQGHTGGVNGCAYSPDGRFLASAADDHTVRIWEVGSGQCLRPLDGHTGYVWSCAYSPDGHFLASAADDHTLRVWEVSSGQLVHTLEGHTSRVRGCAYSPDGHFLASASLDRTLRVWDPSTGRALCRFTADAELTCCTFHPQDATQLVAGDASGRLHWLRLVL